MNIEVRTLGAGDLDAAFRLEQIAFNVPDERRELWQRWLRPEREHGAFVGGRLAAAAYAWPLGQFFGGRSVAMGGLAGVAVAPEHRGRGLARRVVGAALAAMRERGEPISTLYPATTSLYRSLGYELAGAAVWHVVSARALQAWAKRGPLDVWRLGPGDDKAALRRCYEGVAVETNGWIDRGDHRWGFHWDRWHRAGYVYACGRARDAVDGYLVYTHEPTPPGWTGDYGVRVEELVAASPDALRALWSTAVSSATQADALTFTSTPEDASLLLWPEQRAAVRAQVRWMLRIVHAPAAIAARGWPPGLSVEVPLELADELLPGNAGAFTLSIEKGEGRLEAGGRGGLRLGIGAFSSLYSGWASAGTLARAGLLEGGSAGQRRALDAAFAGPTPWMPEMF